MTRTRASKPDALGLMHDRVTPASGRLLKATPIKRASEADLLRAVTSALTLAGHHVLRLQSGKVPVKRGFMQLCPLGTPDLAVLSRAGRTTFLELKRDAASKPTAEQLRWHAMAVGLGHRVAVVRTVQEAVDAIGGAMLPEERER